MAEKKRKQSSHPIERDDCETKDNDDVREFLKNIMESENDDTSYTEEFIDPDDEDSWRILYKDIEEEEEVEEISENSSQRYAKTTFVEQQQQIYQEENEEKKRKLEEKQRRFNALKERIQYDDELPFRSTLRNQNNDKWKNYRRRRRGTYGDDDSDDEDEYESQRYRAPSLMPAFADGPLDAEIMIVGEWPGKQELQKGKAFVGPTGRFLRKTLKELYEKEEEEKNPSLAADRRRKREEEKTNKSQKIKPVKRKRGVADDLFQKKTNENAEEYENIDPGFKVLFANVMLLPPPRDKSMKPLAFKKHTKYIKELLDIVRPKLVITMGLFSSNFFKRLLSVRTMCRAPFCEGTERVSNESLFGELYTMNILEMKSFTCASCPRPNGMPKKSHIPDAETLASYTEARRKNSFTFTVVPLQNPARILRKGEELAEWYEKFSQAVHYIKTPVEPLGHIHCYDLETAKSNLKKRIEKATKELDLLERESSPLVREAELELKKFVAAASEEPVFETYEDISRVSKECLVPVLQAPDIDPQYLLDHCLVDETKGGNSKYSFPFHTTGMKYDSRKNVFHVYGVAEIARADNPKVLENASVDCVVEGFKFHFNSNIPRQILKRAALNTKEYFNLRIDENGEDCLYDEEEEETENVIPDEDIFKYKNESFRDVFLSKLRSEAESLRREIYQRWEKKFPPGSFGYSDEDTQKWCSRDKNLELQIEIETGCKDMRKYYLWDDEGEVFFRFVFTYHQQMKHVVEILKDDLWLDHWDRTYDDRPRTFRWNLGPEEQLCVFAKVWLSCWTYVDFTPRFTEDMEPVCRSLFLSHDDAGRTSDYAIYITTTYDSIRSFSPIEPDVLKEADKGNVTRKEIYSRHPPSRLLAFDAEMLNRKGRFPKPSDDPVISIANEVHFRDSTNYKMNQKSFANNCEAHILVAAWAAVKQEDFVKEGVYPRWVKVHVHQYKEELDMLLAQAVFMKNMNCQTMTCHNGVNFDLDYFENRLYMISLIARKLPRPTKAARDLLLGEKARVFRCSPNREGSPYVQRKKFANRAFGEKIISTFAEPAANYIDTLDYFTREKKLISYTLNSLADKEIGALKHDVPYVAIPGLYFTDPFTVALLVIYNAKDTSLTARIFIKNKCEVTALEFSRTLRTIKPDRLYRGGTGEKVTSFIMHMIEDQKRRQYMEVRSANDRYMQVKGVLYNYIASEAAAGRKATSESLRNIIKTGKPVIPKYAAQGQGQAENSNDIFCSWNYGGNSRYHVEGEEEEGDYDLNVWMDDKNQFVSSGACDGSDDVVHFDEDSYRYANRKYNPGYNYLKYSKNNRGSKITPEAQLTADLLNMDRDPEEESEYYDEYVKESEKNAEEYFKSDYEIEDGDEERQLLQGLNNTISNLKRKRNDSNNSERTSIFDSSFKLDAKNSLSLVSKPSDTLSTNDEKVVGLNGSEKATVKQIKIDSYFTSTFRTNTEEVRKPGLVLTKLTQGGRIVCMNDKEFNEKFKKQKREKDKRRTEERKRSRGEIVKDNFVPKVVQDILDEQTESGKGNDKKNAKDEGEEGKFTGATVMEAAKSFFRSQNIEDTKSIEMRETQTNMKKFMKVKRAKTSEKDSEWKDMNEVADESGEEVDDEMKTDAETVSDKLPDIPTAIKTVHELISILKKAHKVISKRREAQGKHAEQMKWDLIRIRAKKDYLKLYPELLLATIPNSRPIPCVKPEIRPMPDPVAGLFVCDGPILFNDFKSLYPSIHQSMSVSHDRILYESDFALYPYKGRIVPQDCNEAPESGVNPRTGKLEKAYFVRDYINRYVLAKKEITEEVNTNELTKRVSHGHFVCDKKGLNPYTGDGFSPNTLLELKKRTKEVFERGGKLVEEIPLPEGYEWKLVQILVGYGIVPEAVRELVRLRNVTKKEQGKYTIKDIEWHNLEGRQLALKTMANAIYGAAGTVLGMLGLKILGANICGFGRDFLAISIAALQEAFGPYNVYIAGGDTDSNMDQYSFVRNEYEGAEMGPIALLFVNAKFEDKRPTEQDFEKFQYPMATSVKKRYAGACYVEAETGFFFSKKRYIETCPEISKDRWPQIFAKRKWYLVYLRDEPDTFEGSTQWKEHLPQDIPDEEGGSPFENSRLEKSLVDYKWVPIWNSVAEDIMKGNEGLKGKPHVIFKDNNGEPLLIITHVGSHLWELKQRFKDHVTYSYKKGSTVTFLFTRNEKELEETTRKLGTIFAKRMNEFVGNKCLASNSFLANVVDPETKNYNITISLACEQWYEPGVLYSKEEWFSKIGQYKKASENYLMQHGMREWVGNWLWRERYTIPNFDVKTLCKSFARGFETVRRDSCPYTRNMMNKFLNKVLLEEQLTNALLGYIEDSKKMLYGEVDISMLICSKGYTKPFEAYKSASLPHLSIIRRAREKGQVEPEIGSRVGYIITRSGGGTNKNAKVSDRAYSPEDVIKDNMQIDWEYYFKKMIASPFEKLMQIFVENYESLLDPVFLVKRSYTIQIASDAPLLKFNAIRHLKCMLCSRYTKTYVCPDCAVSLKKIYTAKEREELKKHLQQEKKLVDEETEKNLDVCRKCTNVKSKDPNDILCQHYLCNKYFKRVISVRERESKFASANYLISLL